MLQRLGRAAARWIELDPWTNVYGAARSVLALGTAATLIFNDTATLIRPGAGIPVAPMCVGPATAGWFCQLAPQLELARWIAVAALLLVASGWRPRFTGVLHWYVVWSFHVNATVIDGGDQIAAILALLLIPVTLTDDRRWHWHARPVDAPVRPIARLVALSTFVVVRVQVAAIYFHAGVGKMGVPEWADATAVHYWFTDPSFGAAPWLAPLLAPVLASAVGITMLTWGTILFEILMFLALGLNRAWWRPLFVAGLLFHGGIAIVQGLISFGITMTAALLLYLRAKDEPFALPRLRATQKRASTAVTLSRPPAAFAAETSPMTT